MILRNDKYRKENRKKAKSTIPLISLILKKQTHGDCCVPVELPTFGENSLIAAITANARACKEKRMNQQASKRVDEKTRTHSRTNSIYAHTHRQNERARRSTMKVSVSELCIFKSVAKQHIQMVVAVRFYFFFFKKRILFCVCAS